MQAAYDRKDIKRATELMERFSWVEILDPPSIPDEPPAWAERLNNEPTEAKRAHRLVVRRATPSNLVVFRIAGRLSSRRSIDLL